MEIGDKASLTKIFTLNDVNLYSKLINGKNTLNFNKNYHQELGEESQKLNSIMVGSLISAVIAEKLPGPGSIYLSQKINFNKSAFIGDEITAEIEIKKIRKNKIFYLLMKCINQKNEIILDGESVILFDSKYIKS